MLQKAVHAYNHSIHRSIKRRPAEVTQEVVGDMREEMTNRRKPPKGKDDIHVGDSVRISKVKSIFDKGYLPNWTEEIFTVENVNRKYRPITYKLKDYRNEIVEGSFYRHEIQPVIHDQDVFLVEKVIRTQRRRGEPWCLVKWQGYPSSMNSWVRKADISQVTQRR